MDADAKKAQHLFSGDHRYIVPAYQRPYVWEEDAQWRPLWEDIERLADSRLDNKEDNHFLGTIVLKQEVAAPGGLSEWSVIDGQQRLTTLQIILSALAYSADLNGLDNISKRLRSFLLHEDYKAQGEERFRFWPTTVNQESYRNIMNPNGPNRSLNDEENTIEEAWLFFVDKIDEYAKRDSEDIELEFLSSDQPKEEVLNTRYGALHDALIGMIELVVIQISGQEKPQVVFETLNARGTPLLATDLIKNALFEKAEDQGLDINEVHNNYWLPGLGDHGYWAKEDSFSNFSAPRSEVFLMQWLAMKTGKPVSSENIFGRFRKEFIDSKDAPPLIELMEELRDDVNIVKGMPGLRPNTPEGSLIKRMHSLGSLSLSPLVLLLLKLDLDNSKKDSAFGALESFLMRRAIIRLQTGGYGALSAEIISAIYKDIDRADEVLISKLVGSQASTARWPTDAEIVSALTKEPLYGTLGRKRILNLLSAIELKRRSSNKSEDIYSLPDNLHIEHIMPQSWKAHWPLDSSTEEKEEYREEHIHLLGNLTLISGSLNISISNSSWENKKDQFSQNSVLLLNTDLSLIDQWNEEEIDKRGQKLTEEIVSIWPGPDKFLPDSWKRPDAEISAEEVEVDFEKIKEILELAPDKLHNLIVNLSEHPDERRSYKDIEDGLGWKRGSVAGVFGSYSRNNPGQKRPFRINLNPNGFWEMWLDSDLSQNVLKIEHDRSQKYIAEIRELVEDQDVLEMIDSLETEVSKHPSMAARIYPFAISKGSRFYCRGYFAKKWLFCWWVCGNNNTRELEVEMKKLFSKPEEVMRNDKGELRFHIANKQDLLYLINIINNN